MTLLFSLKPWRSNSIARSLSPRIGSTGVKSRNTASLSKSLPNELSERVVSPHRVMTSWRACQSRYVVASAGSGASPPREALDHAAWKNSSFVAIRSALRDLIRSSSRKITSQFGGMRSEIVSNSSTSNGIRDSIPSQEIPAAILLRISDADGNFCSSAAARSWISGVRINSRQGRISITSVTGS